MNLKCNCCDGIYNSFDVHFTSACDNKCAHCVDKCYEGKQIVKPDVDKIVKTIVDNQDGLDDVLFLGGEPCLFLDELIDCCEKLREQTNLKLYVTTSVPKTCYDNQDKLAEQKPTGSYQEMVTFQLGAIATMLADISKSLAILAHKAESEVEE